MLPSSRQHDERLGGGRFGMGHGVEDVHWTLAGAGEEDALHATVIAVQGNCLRPHEAFVAKPDPKTGRNHPRAGATFQRRGQYHQIRLEGNRFPEQRVLSPNQ